MPRDNTNFKKVFMFVNVDWFFISHRLPIAQNARKYDMQITVFTDQTQSDISFESFKFDMLQSPLSRSTRNYFLFLWELLKSFFLISKNKPDLIHAVTIKPIILLGIISRVTKTPFLGAISGLGPILNYRTTWQKVRFLFVIYLYRFIFNSNRSAVICQNHNDKDILLKQRVSQSSSIFIIPGSGVNLEFFRPKENEGKNQNVLMASRLLKDKGVYEFCAAAQALQYHQNNVNFMLAGPVDSSSPSAITEDEIKALCLSSGVDYLGNRKDLNSLLPLASIFVLPSYYPEGIPKVLLEAASCGIPIITTNHPGCRDAIVDNRTGILVEPADSKALADAIELLLSDPKRMLEMGKAGRKMAEELFDEKKVIQSHYKLYKKYTQRAF